MAFRIAPLFALTLLLTQAQVLFAADMNVRVEGIRTNAGHLLMAVSSTPAAWNGEAEPAAVQRIVATGGTAETRFSELAPGRYAVQVMHDANDNGDLDSNLVGMPIEGYGFSNNPRVMRKATFEEAAFDVPGDGTSIVIHLN
jgi:uncharacterized protein (DUF2141 family)